MNRYSIHGHREDEFHPYEACEVFKHTHDSREVEKAILPLFRERILSPTSRAGT